MLRKSPVTDKQERYFPTAIRKGIEAVVTVPTIFFAVISFLFFFNLSSPFFLKKRF